MSSKFLLSALAGAAVVFIFGYLIYGVLLTDFMRDHSGTATGVAKNANEFQFAYIILANLLYGFMLAFIFSKSGTATLAKGFGTALVIGFLTSASNDFISYGTANVLTLPSLAADVAGFSILSGLAGVAVAWVRGLGKPAARPTAA
ncbi:MAG TPA: hypothetical protein VKR32_18635 [Puia sp.]|nr:hypothetical protein [Puia sp.]